MACVLQRTSRPPAMVVAHTVPRDNKTDVDQSTTSSKRLSSTVADLLRESMSPCAVDNVQVLQYSHLPLEDSRSSAAAVAPSRQSRNRSTSLVRMTPSRHTPTRLLLDVPVMQHHAMRETLRTKHLKHNN